MKKPKREIQKGSEKFSDEDFKLSESESGNNKMIDRPNDTIGNNPESSDEKPEVYIVKKFSTTRSGGRREFIANSVLAGAAVSAGTGLLSGCKKDESPRSDYISLLAMMDSAQINSVMFSPDSTILVSCRGHISGDNVIVEPNEPIKLWSMQDGKVIKDFGDFNSNYQDVQTICFSPDGKFVASGSNFDFLMLWNIPEAQIVKVIDELPIMCWSVSFSQDSKMLASVGKDNTVKIWSIPDGQLLNTLTGHSEEIYSVGFSPDGKLVASGGADGTVRFWSITDGQLLKSIDLISCWSLSFSPDGTMLATGGGDNNVKLWSVSDGQLLNTMDGHTNGIMSVSFSPDGKMVASGSADNTIKLWSIPDGQLLNTMEGHSKGITSVNFSPDGKLIASGSFDRTIRLWSIPNGEFISLSCVCDTVCTCNTVSTNNGSDICTCNTVEVCTCFNVCSCNSVCSCVGHGGGSYWYPC